MIHPSQVRQHQEIAASMHGIHHGLLNHPLHYYIEPDEVKVLEAWRSVGVKQVGSFLIWAMYYGAWREPPVGVSRADIFNILQRLKAGHK